MLKNALGYEHQSKNSFGDKSMKRRLQTVNRKFLYFRASLLQIIVWLRKMSIMLLFPARIRKMTTFAVKCWSLISNHSCILEWWVFTRDVIMDHHLVWYWKLNYLTSISKSGGHGQIEELGWCKNAIWQIIRSISKENLQFVWVSSTRIFSFLFHCRLAVRGDYQDKKFGDFLKETEVFTNPASIDNLLIDSGLDPRKSYSLTMSSKGKFQSDEYAKDLRQVHASKLAFRYDWNYAFCIKIN